MRRHGKTGASETAAIRVELTFGCPAFLCLLGCVWTWRGMLYFLCALLLHELGHCAALRWLRVPVRRVRLGFGDVEMETTALGYREELISAWAGPFVNLMLGGAFFRIAPPFATVQLLLGCYNLLPVVPLDGGRMLSAALHRLLPERAARRLCRIWSLLAAVCLLALGLYAAGHGGLLPLLIALGLCARLALTEAG